VEGRVSGDFARVLEAGRNRFNAKFAYAKRLNRHLEAADFLEHLAGVVVPIVDSVAGLAGQEIGQKIDQIITELYDLSLELFAQGCLGKNRRYPVVEKAWKKLLPEIPGLIVRAPRRLVTSVSNAIFNLSAEKGTDENRWLDMMRAIAPLCTDEETFLKAGIVSSWRFGMAHFREGALASCENIAIPILARIFDLKAGIDTSGVLSVLQRIQKDRWYDPTMDSIPEKTQLAIVERAGGFKGFGGPFVCPPRVRISEGKILLFDAKHCFSLHADIFGTTLRRIGKGGPAEDSPASLLFGIDKNGKVMKKSMVRHFPELAYSASWTSTEDTLVVCLPDSHYVYLVAQQSGRDDV